MACQLSRCAGREGRCCSGRRSPRTSQFAWAVGMRVSRQVKQASRADRLCTSEKKKPIVSRRLREGREGGSGLAPHTPRAHARHHLPSPSLPPVWRVLRASLRGPEAIWAGRARAALKACVRAAGRASLSAPCLAIPSYPFGSPSRQTRGWQQGLRQRPNRSNLRSLQAARLPPPGHLQATSGPPPGPRPKEERWGDLVRPIYSPHTTSCPLTFRQRHVMICACPAQSA